MPGLAAALERRAAVPGETFGGAPEEAPLPHVVAWNLTRRCNLECAHCYISAGPRVATTGELGTPECIRILDEILAVNSGVLLILSGGEPLLREDLETIAARGAAGGATVVVGTNGTRLSDRRIRSLAAAGVTGFAVSIDSLDPWYHDRFRHGQGALGDTLAAVERLRDARLDFIVQATVTRGNRDELASLAEWSAAAGAVSFNVYFLVETGRGERMRGLSPAENDAVLRELLELERLYRGRMLVRAKCQPQIMRHAFESDPDSPLLYYGTRCPCGIHYCRITPEGKLTPCPYLPVVAGDLREERFDDVWRDSPVFRLLRGTEPGGRCGRCEYRVVCGGCRARAWVRDGDFLDEDPSCAYEPTGDAPVVRPVRPVVYGEEHRPELEWTAEARARLERIPSFVRGVVVHRVEGWARRNGHHRVTPELMERIRSELPIDFSRRLPFFARQRDPR